MRRLLLTVAAALTWVVLSGPARAGDVEDRQARVSRAAAELGRLETTHRALAEQHQKKLAEAEQAARQRKFNASSKKADALDFGKKLEESQKRIADARNRLLAERRALVAVLERELAARPDDARLQKQLAGEKAKLPAQVRKLKIADEQIEPGDYPEDLDQKAARLRKSENELLAEILRAETRASTLRKQVKLAKSNTRARTGDLFHDGEKSRKGHGANSESRGGAAPAADADSGGGGGAGGAGGAPAGEQPPPADPGFTDDEANQGLDASPTPGAVPIPQDVGVDVTVQYQGVIDQSELDSLRRDQKSSDPEVRARVAERLAAALKARAERVKKQRQAIENRAKQLRGK